MKKSEVYHKIAIKHLITLLVTTVITGISIGLYWYFHFPMAPYLMVLAAYIWNLFTSVYGIIEYRGYERIARLEEIGRWTR